MISWNWKCNKSSYQVSRNIDEDISIIIYSRVIPRSLGSTQKALERKKKNLKKTHCILYISAKGTTSAWKEGCCTCWRWKCPSLLQLILFLACNCSKTCSSRNQCSFLVTYEPQCKHCEGGKHLFWLMRTLTIPAKASRASSCTQARAEANRSTEIVVLKQKTSSLIARFKLLVNHLKGI
jgi:hypothetical protein